MQVSKWAYLGAVSSLATLCGLTGARAETVITFADPSSGPATPLFSYSGNTLTGGWAGPGLTLQTPGLTNTDYSNATFTMTALSRTSDSGSVHFLSGGELNFFDSGDNLLLTIEFASAELSGPLGLGASDFIGDNVTFSGPVLGGESFTNEAFAFAFANPIGTLSDFTVTASFTSSGDPMIPGPGSAALLGSGVMGLWRRRRPPNVALRQ